MIIDTINTYHILIYISFFKNYIEIAGDRKPILHGI